MPDSHYLTAAEIRRRAGLDGDSGHGGHRVTSTYVGPETAPSELPTGSVPPSLQRDPPPPRPKVNNVGLARPIPSPAEYARLLAEAKARRAPGELEEES
jgi:hypothetical protein